MVNKTVLVVDDNAQNVELLTAYSVALGRELDLLPEVPEPARGTGA